MRSCNQRGPSGVVNGMLPSLSAIREEERACLRPTAYQFWAVPPTFRSRPTVARNVLLALSLPPSHVLQAERRRLGANLRPECG
jgi:hypothetical protein